MNLHKKLIIRSLFLLTLIFGISASTLFAQRGGMSRNPEEIAKKQTKEMTKELDLSPEQAEEVMQINKESAEKTQALMQESQGNREEMRTGMQEIQMEKDKKLKEVLDEEQWGKWEKMKEQMRKQQRERRRGGY
ncbi:hypothetical protein [Xanthovirga aplysinae]|uniref:hypothetical protein n=1 Tax=Xanthovirga aplysinae TaxID=2529853 RepID=UPI0012BC757B|nr:hypothetical protein [Xanthovirga aplysinae]MTI32839.1 hypothetical protein [Xanthovirga aplysinae]